MAELQQILRAFLICSEEFPHFKTYVDMARNTNQLIGLPTCRFIRSIEFSEVYNYCIKWKILEINDNRVFKKSNAMSCSDDGKNLSV